MKTILITTVSLLLLQAIHAQQGYSSGSMGMMQSEDYAAAYTNTKFNTEESKKQFRERGIQQLLPNHIVPTEILNYHHHQIALPSKGSKINLAPEITPHPFFKDHYLMQIGIATDSVIPEHHGTMGLMYVLDISGSMEGNRLENAKRALIASLKILSPNDYVGVVIFDDVAETTIPYGLMGNRKQAIIDAIQALQTRGGTNILAGLNLGLDNMAVVTKTEIPQTLVILTDGNTNTGNTKKEDILFEITKKTKNNIRVTTMGLGIDLRYDLLRDISRQSHGQFHYIERDQDIEKVCVKEFASVAMPIGKHVSLNVQLPEYLEAVAVYGSDSLKIDGANIDLYLEDVNYALTQVILIDLKFNSNYNFNPEEVKTMLSYVSYETETPVGLLAPAQLISNQKGEETLYCDLLKNFLIADWAYGFRAASEAYSTGKDQDVLEKNLKNMLDNPIAAIKELEKDADVLRLKKVFGDLTILLG